MTTSPAAPVASWREELRRDRLVRAQMEREREAGRVRLRIAERDAAARARQEQAQARAAARRRAQRERAARRAELAAWVRGHVVDLLFVPVIVVPGLLSWTAMAAYGLAAYGSPGLALPALSEGAMWAFAVATTITRRRHPDRPVWHLRLGTLVFAAYGAALNFAHGMSPAVPGHGPVTGTVYALVSVAGVTAHQLVTAGPRRSRAERNRARIARAAARRELAARRAAVKNAVAELDEHGNARLVYQPGAAIAARRGRTRLLSPDTADDTAPALTLTLAGPACAWPRPAPVLPAAPGEAASESGAPVPAPGRTRTRKPGAPRSAGAPRTRAVTDESAEVHFAAELAEGQVPSKRRIKTELHVGQDRAAQIHDHLAAVAAAGHQPAPAPEYSGRTA
jgi:hypothetical protein